MERPPQPEPELDRQRTIEAVGRAQLRREFLRDASAGSTATSDRRA
jgi:hypothetical protein